MYIDKCVFVCIGSTPVTHPDLYYCVVSVIRVVYRSRTKGLW